MLGSNCRITNFTQTPLRQIQRIFPKVLGAHESCFCSKSFERTTSKWSTVCGTSIQQLMVYRLYRIPTRQIHPNLNQAQQCRPANYMHGWYIRSHIMFSKRFVRSDGPKTPSQRNMFKRQASGRSPSIWWSNIFFVSCIAWIQNHLFSAPSVLHSKLVWIISGVPRFAMICENFRWWLFVHKM